MYFIAVVYSLIQSIVSIAVKCTLLPLLFEVVSTFSRHEKKSNVGKGAIVTRFLGTTEGDFIICSDVELLIRDIIMDASLFEPSIGVCICLGN